MKTHKTYPRMPRLEMPAPQAIATPLSSALEARRSHEANSAPLNTERLSTLLFHALGARKDGTRRYPSGGALYPIETYVIALAAQNVPRACLHYHPTAHALEYLWDVPDSFDTRAFVPTAADAAALIVLTGVWNKTCAKYGDFGYLNAILEAGHAAQNILLTATALELAACPIGGFDDRQASALFDLDTEVEQPICAVAIGKLTTATNSV